MRQRPNRVYRPEYSHTIVVEYDGQVYHFYSADRLADKAEEVRGEVPDNMVVPVESPSPYVAHLSIVEPGTIPSGVIEMLDNRKVRADVETGWVTWGGRPDFDESRGYVDFNSDD